MNIGQVLIIGFVFVALVLLTFLSQVSAIAFEPRLDRGSISGMDHFSSAQLLASSRSTQAHPRGGNKGPSVWGSTTGNDIRSESVPRVVVPIHQTYGNPVCWRQCAASTAKDCPSCVQQECTKACHGAAPPTLKK